MFNQCFGPVLIYYCFEYFFDDDSKEGGLTEDQMKVLREQFYMQCIQVCSFLYIFFIPVRPHWCCKCCIKIPRYLAWLSCMLIYLVIPLVSIIHWGVNFSVAADPDCVIRPWLFTYPMIGAVTLVIYFTTVNRFYLPLMR